MCRKASLHPCWGSVVVVVMLLLVLVTAELQQQQQDKQAQPRLHDKQTQQEVHGQESFEKEGRETEEKGTAAQKQQEQGTEEQEQDDEEEQDGYSEHEDGETELLEEDPEEQEDHESEHEEGQQTCSKEDTSCKGGGVPASAQKTASHAPKTFIHHDDHSHETPHQKYSIGARGEQLSRLQLIHEAEKVFKPCNNNCSCHYQQISVDLAPFKQGITKAMVDGARDRGVLYQVLDGRLYREESCSFPARCEGLEHSLLELAPKLPNMEFLMNVRDWPQVTRHHGGGAAPPTPPVFSFSKQVGEHLDILAPAWGFWSGGPAIALHPTGLGRWDVRRKTIAKAAAKWVWRNKTELAFFRGSRTTSDRDAMVLLSRTRPDLADVQYTKNQAWRSDQDTLGAAPAAEVTLERHCQYKYLFNFRGVAASFRYKHLFMCNSLVMQQEDDWIEFFYPQLKPWIHYVPVPSRPSVAELINLVEFARNHDAVMKGIARAGRRFIAQRLRPADVACYWRKLLRTYARLLRYKPQRREGVELVGEGRT